MPAPVIRTLQENNAGRDFAVGDIHGCFSVLEDALAAVQFDGTRDRLISVGDLVDRGPESERALDFLQQSWFYAVRGNHEAEAAYFAQELGEGGIYQSDLEFCKSLGGAWLLKPETRPILSKIREAFNALPYVIEVETPNGSVGFLHAEVPLAFWRKGADGRAKEFTTLDWPAYKRELELSVERNDSRDAKNVRASTLHGRSRIHRPAGDPGVAGVHRLFVGHTPVSPPMRLGNVFYIDTGACYEDGYLSVVDIRARDEQITAVAGEISRFNTVEAG